MLAREKAIARKGLEGRSDGPRCSWLAEVGGGFRSYMHACVGNDVAIRTNGGRRKHLVSGAERMLRWRFGCHLLACGAVRDRAI